VEGCFRFLGRVFRLVDKNIELLKMDLRCGGEETKVVKDILYYTHSTIKKVTNDIEKFQHNTAVAAIMEFTNNLMDLEPKLNTEQEKYHFKKAVEAMIILLTPFTPHIAEEMWSLIGRDGLVSKQPWPFYE